MTNDTCLMLKNIPNRFRSFATMNLLFANDAIARDPKMRQLVADARHVTHNVSYHQAPSQAVRTGVQEATRRFSWEGALHALRANAATCRGSDPALEGDVQKLLGKRNADHQREHILSGPWDFLTLPAERDAATGAAPSGGGGGGGDKSAGGDERGGGANMFF